MDIKAETKLAYRGSGRWSVGFMNQVSKYAARKKGTLTLELYSNQAQPVAAVRTDPVPVVVQLVVVYWNTISRRVFEKLKLERTLRLHVSPWGAIIVMPSVCCWLTVLAVLRKR